MQKTYRIEGDKLIITTTEVKEEVISLDDVNNKKDSILSEIERYTEVLQSAAEIKTKLEMELVDCGKYTEAIKGEKGLEELGFAEIKLK